MCKRSGGVVAEGDHLLLYFSLGDAISIHGIFCEVVSYIEVLVCRDSLLPGFCSVRIESVYLFH